MFFFLFVCFISFIKTNLKNAYKKKAYTKYPINEANQSLLSYNIYKNQIHCEMGKQKNTFEAYSGPCQTSKTELFAKTSKTEPFAKRLHPRFLAWSWKTPLHITKIK